MRNADRVLQAAAEIFGVEMAEIVDTRRRTIYLANVRAAIFWVLHHTRPDLTQAEIAHAIGMADRRSVYDGVRKAEQLAGVSSAYADQLEALHAVCGGALDRAPVLTPAAPLTPHRPRVASLHRFHPLAYIRAITI